MAQRDRIPTKLVMDGAKEQVMGEFRKKVKEMGVRVSDRTILPMAECSRRCYTRGKAWHQMQNDEDKVTCIIIGSFP